MYIPELQIGEPLPVGTYVDPPLSSDAEIDSFNFQVEAVNKTEKPKNLEAAMQRVERRYQSSRWKVREDFLSDQHINDILDIMQFKQGKRTPGAIFMRNGCTTNTAVFAKFGRAAVFKMVKNRLFELLDRTKDHRYVCDAIRIFIKREAHKKSKALQKRWRLIWGVSLIDQCIDRLLYAEVCEKEIEMYEEIPSKPGLGFMHGTTHKLVSKYSNGSKKWISFDAKSFDISCPGWGLAAVREINERLCSNPFGSQWELWKQLSEAREQAALYGKFVFSNGVVCLKTKPCIQPSGRFTTISTNCKLVVLLRDLDDIDEGREFAQDNIIAMGDDTVQDGLDDPQRFVDNLKRKYGVQFTIESEQGEFCDQNFCSKKFAKTKDGVYVPVPLNWDKNVYELCNVERKVVKSGETQMTLNRAGALSSLCAEYAFHEKFNLLHEKLAMLDGGRWFNSKNYFQNLVTGFEGAGAELGKFPDTHYAQEA